MHHPHGDHHHFPFFPAPVASRDGVSRLHFGSATATPLSTRWVFENKIRAKPGETYLFFAKDFSPITFFRSYTLCSTMTSGGHLKRFSSNNSKIQTRVTKILEKQSEKSHGFEKFEINVHSVLVLYLAALLQKPRLMMMENFESIHWQIMK